MMAVFDFLGLELLAASPCIMRGIDYYQVLPLAAMLPVLASVVVVTACICWAACSPPAPSRADDPRSGGEANVICRGLWLALPLVVWVMDLSFAMVTRTMLQFFVCRDMKTGPDGSSGWWLEAARQDSAEHFFQIERAAFHSSWTASPHS